MTRTSEMGPVAHNSSGTWLIFHLLHCLACAVLMFLHSLNKLSITVWNEHLLLSKLENAKFHHLHFILIICCTCMLAFTDVRINQNPFDHPCSLSLFKTYYASLCFVYHDNLTFYNIYIGPELFIPIHLTCLHPLEDYLIILTISPRFASPENLKL